MRRVAVLDGRLDVIDSAITGDAETDAALEAIAADTAQTGPRAWVSWLAAGAYERTAAVLDNGGVIRRTTVRRLGLVPATRCVPANVADLVKVRSRLRYALHSPGEPDESTAALSGLVRVLRLESSLLLSMPTADLRQGLERLARANATTVRQVITAVDVVISAATYR
jgi:hypothetical protein